MMWKLGKKYGRREGLQTEDRESVRVVGGQEHDMEYGGGLKVEKAI